MDAAEMVSLTGDSPTQPTVFILVPNPKGRAQMKRDMELVREILVKIHDKETMKPELIQIDGHDDAVVSRHIEMLFDAGLIEGLPRTSSNAPAGKMVFVTDLSWEGHDFLSALQNSSVWSQIKGAVSAKELAGLPLSVLKEVGVGLLNQWMREKVGLPG